MIVMRLCALICLLSFAAGATAAEPDTTVTTIADLDVRGEAVAWGDGAVPPSFLADHGDGNLGEALENLPGVWMIRRAPSGTDPVIRGLGYERVLTVLGAVPLHGACPGRMDPPVTYLSPRSLTGLDLTRSASADAGVGGYAGAIRANPDLDRGPEAGTEWTPFVDGGWESARNAWRAEGGVEGGSDDFDLRASVGHRQNENYTAPNGQEVPARLTRSAADLALGWRPAAGQRLWTALNFVHEQDVDYPAMPMDNRDTDTWIWNAGWRKRYAGSGNVLELTGGFSAVDHLMDNADKPNRGMMEAETPAETGTWAVRARTDLAAGALDLRLGADLERVTKDAIRTRTMTATGMTFRDHIWPDAAQLTGGVLARAGAELTPSIRVTGDARFDLLSSEARAADDPSLGGRTVRQQYVAYYGPEAADTDRDETLAQVSLRLDGTTGRAGAWHVRTGLASRAAGITERYYAFGPAPGGFQVGNPTLAAESPWQTEAGLSLAGTRLAAGLTVFHTEITDYILPTVIDRRDVNGDGIVDTVKGFLNRDARLSGGEFALEWRPHDRLLLPATLAYVRGRNVSDGRDLPEIPAFGGQAELRWLLRRTTRCWLAGGARFAAAQDHVDPDFRENPTAAWVVWHLALRTRPVPGLEVRLLLDNLFDRTYHDHLTREAVMAVGGLAAGDEIPAPGRSFSVSARWDF